MKITSISLPRAAAGGLSVRPIRNADMDFLCALYASTRAEEMAQVPWSDAERAEFLAMQFEAQHSHYMRQYPHAAFWLVVKGDRPVGRLYLDEWEDEFRLIDIALMPEHRGRGLGTLLLEDVMEAASVRGKVVRIHVEKNNPARTLYARLGYRQIEDKGVYDLLEWRDERDEAVQTAAGGGC